MIISKHFNIDGKKISVVFFYMEILFERCNIGIIIENEICFRLTNNIFPRYNNLSFDEKTLVYQSIEEEKLRKILALRQQCEDFI